MYWLKLSKGIKRLVNNTSKTPAFWGELMNLVDNSKLPKEENLAFCKMAIQPSCRLNLLEPPWERTRRLLMMLFDSWGNKHKIISVAYILWQWLG